MFILEPLKIIFYRIINVVCVMANLSLASYDRLMTDEIISRMVNKRIIGQQAAKESCPVSSIESSFLTVSS